MRAKLLCVAALLGAIVMSAPISAQVVRYSVTAYENGEALTRACRVYMRWKRTGVQLTAQEAFDAGSCYMYVTGVVDFMYFQGKEIMRTFSGGPICLPEKANANSLTEVVGTFLDKNLELRHFSGTELVMRALFHSFPCPAPAIR